MTKTLIKSQAGVRLVEEREGREATSRFRLSTYRQAQPRMMVDRDEALAAFAHEVTASLADPVVQGMIRRGAI